MKRSVWLITLCLLLMITPSSFFSENVQAGLEETTLWETLDLSCLDSTHKPTTLLAYGDYVYLGTSDSASPNGADIYRIDANDVCEKWQETDQEYIYTSVIYNNTLFWGTSDGGFDGRLYTYNPSNGTFGEIDYRIWWGDGILPRTGPWIQTLSVHNDTMFLGVSTMTSNYPYYNNNAIKYCHTTGCWDSTYWVWTDTNESRIGTIDDILSMGSFWDTLYAGTYDWASVLIYHWSNATWWYSLNASVDGPAGMKGGSGIYTLTNYSSCLNAFTYFTGTRWELCSPGGTWQSTNLSQNSQFSRGIIYNSKIYHGVLDNNNYQRIQTFDNTSFQPVFQESGSEFFLYFAEFQSLLYASKGANVYVRHSNTVAKIRITSPTGGVDGMVKLTATVLTDRSVENVKMVLAEYDTSFTLFKDPKRPIYYYEWFHTDNYADGYYHFVARLNSTDGSSSWDNVSFEIVNSRHEHLKKEDDGTIKITHQLPWVPRGDELPGPDYFVGLRYNDPYYIQVAHITESSSNPSTVHASYQPYDLNENDVEVTEDILWLSEVGDSSRTWTNDTHSTEDTSDDTILKNATSVLFVVLDGENITIQGDGYETFSFMRQSTVHTVNTVLWKEENDGSYTAHVKFYNNHTEPHDYTVFFVGLAEDRLTNEQIPLNPYKTTMYDYHNGLYLDMGIEYTVSTGGYWFAITGFPSASSRPFTFNYFPDIDDQETDLLLVPYCDPLGTHDTEKPIKCLAEHHQEGPQGFQGTIRFDLSQIRSYGRIDWNTTTLIDDANNLILKRGVDWYPSGAYEITLANQEVEVSERVKFEIQLGVLERDPLDVVEDIDIEGVACFSMGIPLLIATVYYSREAMRSRGKKKRTTTMIALLWFAMLVLVAIVFLPYILG